MCNNEKMPEVVFVNAWKHIYRTSCMEVLLISVDDEILNFVIISPSIIDTTVVASWSTIVQ